MKLFGLVVRTIPIEKKIITMYKKIVTIAVIVLFALLNTGSVYAKSFNFFGRGEGGEVKGVVQNVREERKDLQGSFVELRDSIRERFGSGPAILKDFLKRGRAAIGSGIVTAKNGTTLTIDKDGTTYTVLTDSKTQFRRRFWGKSTLDEISVNDAVNVIGKWTDDTQKTIQATLVRDVSIQKRFGVFFGQVLSVTSTGWVMSTIGGNRPNQTVTVSSTTKFMDLVGHTITASDVALGHRVRVKGMWDNANNTVTEVKEVKDFNLPQ
jgi:hypothetical protein